MNQSRGEIAISTLCPHIQWVTRQYNKGEDRTEGPGLQEEEKEDMRREERGKKNSQTLLLEGERSVGLEKVRVEKGELFQQRHLAKASGERLKNRLDLFGLVRVGPFQSIQQLYRPLGFIQCRAAPWSPSWCRLVAWCGAHLKSHDRRLLRPFVTSTFKTQREDVKSNQQQNCDLGSE